MKARSDQIEELFKLYYNEAKLYTYSLTKDLHLAEDVVMDAFYKALIKDVPHGVSFKFWLLRVCKNKFLDHVRKAKRYSFSDGVKEPSSDDGEIDKIIKNEEYAALYKAIGLLEASYREAITLYYFDRLSVAEIGKLMEKSPEYVRVLLMRAKVKLKNKLEEV